MPNAFTTRRPRPPAPGLLVPLTLAAAIALVVPALGGDALSEGIARASRCDAVIDQGPARWDSCIQAQRTELAARPVAQTALHFHAWRLAERAVAQGMREAAALRETHRRQLAAALRGNRLSLHRLCLAAGADCTTVAERLGDAG